MKKEPIIQDPNESFMQRLFRLKYNGASKERIRQELESHWKEIRLKKSDTNSESPSSQPEDGPQKD